MQNQGGRPHQHFSCHLCPRMNPPRVPLPGHVQASRYGAILTPKAIDGIHRPDVCLSSSVCLGKKSKCSQGPQAWIFDPAGGPRWLESQGKAGRGLLTPCRPRPSPSAHLQPKGRPGTGVPGGPVAHGGSESGLSSCGQGCHQQ